MKITFELTPDEAKELMTPGQAQVTAYQNLTAAFVTGWLKTMGDIQKNARPFTAREKV